MAEEDSFIDNVDVSDLMDDSEQYADIESENPDTEAIEADIVESAQDSEALPSEEQTTGDKKPTSNKSEVIRTTKLPMARIKHIMKMDPDVNIVSADAVFLVTKATELFLETMAKETLSYTATKKRIAKKDLDHVISVVDCLCFLEGAMDF